jgi:hypothetical protein
MGHSLFGDIGASLGRAAGNALPGLLGFKNGGRVPGPRGKPRKAIVHGGEYILANGIEPTKAQKKKVAALHRKKK